MQYIDMKNSLDSKLQIVPICSIRILTGIEVKTGNSNPSQRNNRNQRKDSKDMICTENIFEGIGNVQQISDKVVQDHNQHKEDEPEEKTRVQQISDNIDNGQFIAFSLFSFSPVEVPLLHI